MRTVAGKCATWDDTAVPGGEPCGLCWGGLCGPRPSAVVVGTVSLVQRTQIRPPARSRTQSSMHRDVECAGSGQFVEVLPTACEPPQLGKHFRYSGASLQVGRQFAARQGGWRATASSERLLACSLVLPTSLDGGRDAWLEPANATQVEFVERQTKQQSRVESTKERDMIDLLAGLVSSDAIGTWDKVGLFLAFATGLVGLVWAYSLRWLASRDRPTRGQTQQSRATRTMTQRDVKARCDAAARAIATLPVERWSAWVLYILEDLDAPPLTGDRTIARRAILEQFERDLHARLQSGRW